MRKILVDKVKEGMVLGRTLYAVEQCIAECRYHTEESLSKFKDLGMKCMWKMK